jgi:hypothetical protein
MDLARKKLGVMLSTGPDHRNLETVIGLSEATLARGAQLYLYLIDDGVRALDDPRVHALPERGAKVFVCAYGCQKRADRPDQRDRPLHRAQLACRPWPRSSPSWW